MPFVIVFALYPGLGQVQFTGPYEILRRLPDAEASTGSPPVMLLFGNMWTTSAAGSGF